MSGRRPLTTQIHNVRAQFSVVLDVLQAAGFRAIPGNPRLTFPASRASPEWVITAVSMVEQAERVASCAKALAHSVATAMGDATTTSSKTPKPVPVALSELQAACEELGVDVDDMGESVQLAQALAISMQAAVEGAAAATAAGGDDAAGAGAGAGAAAGAGAGAGSETAAATGEGGAAGDSASDSKEDGASSLGGSVLAQDPYRRSMEGTVESDGGFIKFCRH